MISNPKGWRDRRQAVLNRKASEESRSEVQAQRWRFYRGEHSQEDLTPEAKLAKDIKEVVEQVDQMTGSLVEALDGNAPPMEAPIVAKEPEPIQVLPEDMNNRDLRQGLEERGYEIPKGTARARLIELYKEKVT